MDRQKPEHKIAEKDLRDTLRKRRWEQNPYLSVKGDIDDLIYGDKPLLQKEKQA